MEIRRGRATSSKQQRTMVLRDILIQVGGFGHWRNAVIKVAQEFVEAENSWTDLGLTREELFEEIRYDDIVQPAIANSTKQQQEKREQLIRWKRLGEKTGGQLLIQTTDNSRLKNQNTC